MAWKESSLNRPKMKNRIMKLMEIIDLSTNIISYVNIRFRVACIFHLGE